MYTKKPVTLFDFDSKVRAKFLGYNSGHMLYRVTACDRVVPSIKTPFLVIASQDDPISVYTDMPHDSLLRNENCTLMVAKNGGHCDFWTQDD